MKHQSYTLNDGKKIDVFDDVFSLQTRTDIFNYCINSNFKIGWGDSPLPERKPHDQFVHSQYTKKDLETIKIFDCLKHKEISDTLNGCVDVMSILNLSVPSDVNHIHTHKEKKVLLYYVNLEWNQGFHGETLFYTEDLESIQFASPYTPGRIMVFDANIPHTIRPQSIIAPQYRFSLSIFFNNK